MSEGPERITEHIWKQTDFAEWQCERCNSYTFSSIRPSSTLVILRNLKFYTCDEVIVQKILGE